LIQKDCHLVRSQDVVQTRNRMLDVLRAAQERSDLLRPFFKSALKGR